MVAPPKPKWNSNLIGGGPNREEQNPGNNLGSTDAAKNRYEQYYSSHHLPKENKLRYKACRPFLSAHLADGPRRRRKKLRFSLSNYPLEIAADFSPASRGGTKPKRIFLSFLGGRESVARGNEQTRESLPPSYFLSMAPPSFPAVTKRNPSHGKKEELGAYTT